jgi:hypothetical protein
LITIHLVIQTMSAKKTEIGLPSLTERRKPGALPSLLSQGKKENAMPPLPASKPRPSFFHASTAQPLTKAAAPAGHASTPQPLPKSKGTTPKAKKGRGLPPLSINATPVVERASVVGTDGLDEIDDLLAEEIHPEPRAPTVQSNGLTGFDDRPSPPKPAWGHNDDSSPACGF